MPGFFMWSPRELPASLSPDTPFCICSGQSKNGKLSCNIAPRGLVRPLKKLSAGGRIEIHPHILLELSEPGRSQGTGSPSLSHPNDIPPFLFWYRTPRGKHSCSPSCLPCPAFLHLIGFLSQTTSLETSCLLVFTGQAPFAIVAAITAPQPSHLLVTSLGQSSLPTCSQVHLLCLSGRHALFLLPLCPCSMAGGTADSPTLVLFL